MKKQNIIFILLILFIIGCNNITGQSVYDVQEYKIGAILPLTGDIAFIGQEMQRGIEIAVEEVNFRGGVNGKPINIIFEDDGFVEANKAVTASQKLINFDNVYGNIITMVEDTKPVAPIHDQAKIPLITLWDVTDDLRDYSSTFSIGFYTEKAGEKMANFAYNNLGLRNVAIIGHHDEWSLTISKAFDEEFTRLGGKIVFEDRLNVDEVDYRNSILKAKEKNIDGIYAPLLPPASANFFRQKFQLNLNGIIMSGDALTPDVWEISPEGVEGTYFTNVYETTNTKAIELKEKYKLKYREDPLAFPLVQMGYDSVLVYAEALKNTNTPAEVIENLHSINNLEVSGPSITFDSDGMVDREEKIYQIQNGIDILIQE